MERKFNKDGVPSVLVAVLLGYNVKKEESPYDPS